MSTTHLHRRGPIQEDRQSLTGYILQGAGFLGFLLGLMLIAGWRG